MGFREKYTKKRSSEDAEFKSLMEDSSRIMNQELRESLITLRLEMGLTQKEFAELTGEKQPLISRLENGSQNITVHKLQRILERTNTGAKLKIEFKKEEVDTMLH